jgi:predicted acylesterase/phospholipase RssA
MNTHEQYRRCLVLAGGGFRFDYYLGLHAAAEDSGRKPDVLLASCGGAIAAAVIAALPDAGARRDWMAGPEMYAFLRAIRSTSRAAPLHTLGAAGLRWLRRAPAARSADLLRDYLFELPDALPLPLPSRPDDDAPALAIVGARLLYDPAQAGARRGAQPLFGEVVFGPERVAALLDGTPAPAADPRWSAGAVDPVLRVEAGVAPADAARSSIADMFYFRSHAVAGRHYSGGVIDLFPIELARRLGREVIMERKMPFNPWLALPALRTEFGIDGAARLRHMHAQAADAWFATRDAREVLRAHGIGKRIDWRGNRVELVVPPTLDVYAAQVRAQWDYGYLKGMAAFAGGRQ